MPAGARISVSYNEFFQLPGVTLSGLEVPDGPRSLFDTAGGELGGSFDAELPLPLLPYAPAGAGLVSTFFDDYYNRIHIIPLEIDFGTLVIETQRQVSVWNAYLSGVTTLESVSFSAPAGITVLGFDAPVDFQPLELKSGVVNASMSGPASIDMTVFWTFNTGDVEKLGVFGSRAKFLPLKPNWSSSQGYRVQYEFKTEIIESRSGREQRIALRSQPRQSLNYQSMVRADQFRAIKGLLWQWHPYAFVQPDFAAYIDLDVPMEAGDTAFVPAVAVSWMVAGQSLLFVNGTDQEIRRIGSVDVDGVNLRPDSNRAWPADTRVYLALAGNLPNEVTLNHPTNDIAELGVSFEVTPGSLQRLPPPAAPLTFNGRELFLLKPNWGRPVSRPRIHPVEIIDFDRGLTSRFVPIKFGTMAHRANYLGRNQAGATQLIDFFRRMRGRQGEFYMPTWEKDFVLKEPSSSGSQTLMVEGFDFYSQYVGSTVMKVVYVMLLDGTVLTRVVSGMTLVNDGADTLISVTGAWGTTISEATTVLTGWLPVWRLSSDNLTVDWRTDSVAEIQLTMETIEDLPVETP